ncbi:MAG: hypothetical protein K2M91_15380 [Lachnospiraceae bacterium]|nr:hypothetical protein [Lachnospiraceae bacterium]
MEFIDERTGTDQIMKKLVKVTLVTVGINVFYIALRVILSLTDLDLFLRTWVKVLGNATIALVIPLLIVVMLVLWINKREQIPQIMRGIVTLVAGAGYLFWAYWVVLFIVFGVQEEWRIAPNLLVTNEGNFLEGSSYVYYRPVAIFFKIPAELTDEIKIKYLEKKYDREFVTDDSSSDYICDNKLSDVKVSLYLTNGKLSDDYVNQMALKYLTEGYNALGIKRGYHIVKDDSGKNDLLYMEFDKEADIQAVSEDISKMISYCMEHTDLFDKYCGNIGLSSFKGNHEIMMMVPFGKRSNWDIDDDYYRHPDRIAEIVTEKYVHYADVYTQIDEQAQQFSEAETEVPKETDSIEPQKDYVEKDARALYEEIFADGGYSYHVNYNAKGNFYVDLGEKDGYNYSLVYDHPSKNGACELFVLYKYTEDTVDNYIIVDMYAVENATKRVVSSGRKHWSDVGTKEYREITERENIPEAE